MRRLSWREVFEVIGVLSVVGGLLLVAFEIRQANRIARAQVVMELASGFNQINSSRFSDSDVAELILLLENPESRELSELDKSRITGLAYQIHNVMWAAQSAYDNGLLSRADLDNYRNDLAGTYESWPGIVGPLVSVYESQPGKKDAYVSSHWLNGLRQSSNDICSPQAPPNNGMELTLKSGAPFARGRAKGAPLSPAAHPGR